MKRILIISSKRYEFPARREDLIIDVVEEYEYLDTKYDAVFVDYDMEEFSQQYIEKMLSVYNSKIFVFSEELNKKGFFDLVDKGVLYIRKEKDMNFFSIIERLIKEV